MSYAYDNLLPDEKFAYQGRVHGFYIWVLIFFLIIGFLLLIPGGFFIPSALLMIVVFGYNLLFLLKTEIVVTNKRVIYKTGIIARNVFELQLNKVESAHLDQSIFQRIIWAGTLIVSGTGWHNKPIEYLAKPSEMKSVIYEKIES